MPINAAYSNLVPDEVSDSRTCHMTQEAFIHGLQFQVKYIGSLVIPRPSSRLEIVAAMRRTRYEFKAKAVKKRKVTLTVSTEGVKVTLRNAKEVRDWSDEDKLLMLHPVYRIFYVSHDWRDFKIWSYIARDGPGNVFRCSVFKAHRKGQAVRIVRTIGQAFEFCNKMVDSYRSDTLMEDTDQRTRDTDQRTMVTDHRTPTGHTRNQLTASDSTRPDTKELNVVRRCEVSLGLTSESVSSASKFSTNVNNKSSSLIKGKSKRIGISKISPKLTPLEDWLNFCSGETLQQEQTTLPLTQQHSLQVMQHKLQHQQQQTQIVLANVTLLKEQLSAESAARIEAQARAHQLLLHNRDLLDHVNELVCQIQQLEVKALQTSHHADALPRDNNATELSGFLIKKFPDEPNTPEGRTFANMRAGLGTESPDSGHKEMSYDSLSNHCNVSSCMNPCDLFCFLSSPQHSNKHKSNIDMPAAEAENPSGRPFLYLSSRKTLVETNRFSSSCAEDVISSAYPTGIMTTGQLVFCQDGIAEFMQVQSQTPTHPRPLPSTARSGFQGGTQPPCYFPTKHTQTIPTPIHSSPISHTSSTSHTSPTKPPPLPGVNPLPPKLDPPPLVSKRTSDRRERRSLYDPSLTDSQCSSVSHNTDSSSDLTSCMKQGCSANLAPGTVNWAQFTCSQTHDKFPGEHKLDLKDNNFSLTDQPPSFLT